MSEWVRRLDSYTEVSPSGTGVHVLMRGVLPHSGKKGDREMYDHGRYFTVTGRRLESTPKSLRTNQPALLALHDETFGGDESPKDRAVPEPVSPPLTDDEVLSKIRASKQAEQFERLWEGDTSAYAQDSNEGRSEADLALVSMLSFFSQDRDQLDRLFRQSGLYREKWERADYRDRTIRKALTGREEFWGAGKDGEHPYLYPYLNSEVRKVRTDPKKNLRAVSLHEVERPGAREWIVKDLIPKGYPSSIYGEGGKAKSLLALHLAISVASEKTTDWLGMEITTAPVLMLDFELDEEEQARRAYDLAAGMGWEKPPKDLLYLGALGYATGEAFKAALAVCKEKGVELILVDSLGPALEGDAESARDVLGFFARNIDPLRDADVTPLLIDHQAKPIKGDKYAEKTQFGSVYKTNLSRSTIQIDGTWADNVLTASLRHKKANFGPAQPLLYAQVSFGPDVVTVKRLFDDFIPDKPPDPGLSASEKIIQALKEKGPMYPNPLAESTSLALQTVKNTLKELRGKELVEYTGNKDGNAREVALKKSVLASSPNKGTGTESTESYNEDLAQHRMVDPDDWSESEPSFKVHASLTRLGEATPEELAADTGLSSAAVSEVLSVGRRGGALLQSDDGGRYRLANPPKKPKEPESKYEEDLADLYRDEGDDDVGDEFEGRI